jgi:hypothetical protein
MRLLSGVRAGEVNISSSDDGMFNVDPDSLYKVGWIREGGDIVERRRMREKGS